MAAASSSAAAEAATTCAADSAPASDDGKTMVPVRVVVRARPLNSTEKAKGEPVVIAVKGNRVLVRNSVGKASGVGSVNLDKSYSYDKAYNQFAKQSDVFEECAMPVIEEVLQGYSATIFAYGQTGTGKTFTMEGSMDESASSGIIPRSIVHIFDKLETRAKTEGEFEYSVRVSFLEVYNEQLCDLFGGTADDLPDEHAGSSYNPRLAATRKPQRPNERLKLVEDSRKGLVKVQNLEEVLVHNASEAFERVTAGLAKRQVAETKCNAFSSRSHGIFTIQIHSKEKTVEGEDLIRVGKLHLVDLAGSENVGRSGAKDRRLREAGNINQSLLTLGRVITALVEHRGHVPYRDSKLTRLLRDSLGGKTKTTIIATLSPSQSAIEETLSTLDYALRARSIKNRPQVNQRMTKRQLLSDFSSEIDHLKGMLQAARDKDGVFLPKAAYDELQAAKASAEMQLEELQELHAVHEAEAAKLGAELLRLGEEVEALTKRAEEAEADLSTARDTIVERDATIVSKALDIEDKQAIIAGQAAAHEELTRQAKGVLTESVTAAATDVAGLQAKVGRMQADAKTARGAVGAISAELSSSLESLAEGGVGFASNQERLATKAASAARDAALQATKAGAAMSEALARVRTAVRTATASTGAAAEAWSAADRKAWSSMEAEASGPSSDGVSSAVRSGASGIEEALAAVTSAAEAQQQAAKDMAERCIKAQEAAAGAWEAFANSHTAAVTRCRDKALSALAAASGAFEENKSALEVFAAKRAEAEAAVVSDLQAKMAAMIAGAFADVKSQREETLTGVITSMSASRTSVGAAGVAVKEASAGLSAGASAAAREGAGVARVETKAVQAWAESAQSHHAEIASATATAAERCAETVKDVGAATAAMTARIGEAAEAAGSVAAKAASELTSAASAASATVGSDLGAQATAATDLASASSKALEVAAAYADESKSESATFTDAIDKWTGTHSAVVARLGPAVRAAPSTGTTPAKRDYLLPRRLASLSPQEAVVARVHARRADGSAITPSVGRSRQAAAQAAEVTPVRVALPSHTPSESPSPSEEAVSTPVAAEAAEAFSGFASASVAAPVAASPPAPVASPVSLPVEQAATETTSDRSSIGSAGSLGRLISKAAPTASPSESASIAGSEATVESDIASEATPKAQAEPARRAARRGRQSAAVAGAVEPKPPSRRATSRSSAASSGSSSSRRSSSRKSSAAAGSGIPVRGKRTATRRSSRAVSALAASDSGNN